ncbi:MAG: hypothetical protein Q9182_001105 [Xanthomendoza sp. 2 TL-2023]
MTKSRSPSRPARLSSQNNPPRLLRVFSGQHLDDYSTYHGRDSVQFDRGEDTLADEESDLSDEGAKENQNELGEKLPEETVEVRNGVANVWDLEAPLKKARSSKSVKDPNLVTWDGPDDPENPKQWSTRRRWAATIVVSSFTFISPVSSSMVAPALPAIVKEFNITNEIESQMILSVFVLAYAIGPLLLGPLSVKIGGGVLSDCWKAEKRGQAISLYSLAPLLGPAIGPIAGGFITENTTWRWIFYATSIADTLIQLSGVFFLRETYPPKLLHIKAVKLRKATGNQDLHTEYEHPERSLLSILENAIIRPFRLIGTQPTVQVLGLFVAYLYGLVYLVLSTFPVLWTERYHESIGIAGLNYISIALGFTLGAQIFSPLNDHVYRIFKSKNGGVGKPEFRIPIMIPGSILCPVGLFIYAWTSQYHTHWIGPNIGVVIFSMGVISGFQCVQTYLVDTYTRYAASALAAVTVLRSLAGFSFPLFAPYMYAKLDYGWGNTLLAFVAMTLGIPAPLLLWMYGEKLRKRSPFAAGGDGTHSPYSSPTPKGLIAARSAVFLLPPSGSQSSPTPTHSSTAPPSTPPQQDPAAYNTPPSAPTVPAAAFWAVLGILIFVLFLLVLARPAWYLLYGRHRDKHAPQYSPTSPPWRPSPQMQHAGPWTPSPGEAPVHYNLSPRQLQQLQLVSPYFQFPSPPAAAHLSSNHSHNKSSDPNRRALLARLAALQNPSIMGAIPDDSILTASSFTSPYQGHTSGPYATVNENWASIKERRLQEARERGEVVEMEVNGDAAGGTGGGTGGGGGGKRVRFREREWAVLASDTGASGVDGHGGGGSGSGGGRVTWGRKI